MKQISVSLRHINGHIISKCYVFSTGKKEITGSTKAAPTPPHPKLCLCKGWNMQTTEVPVGAYDLSNSAIFHISLQNHIGKKKWGGGWGEKSMKGKERAKKKRRSEKREEREVRKKGKTPKINNLDLDSNLGVPM